MPGRVAVVLPAYNEALGLERLVWRVARALSDLDYEILVVDDGSTDETPEIAASLESRVPLRLVRHVENAGYGAAIRTGLLEARRTADTVVTMDADDSHDPSMIPLMLHGLAGGSDVIVASRFVAGGREVGVPFHRRVLSHGAAFVFGRLLRVPGVHDYTSGYRAYSKELLDRMVSLYGETDIAREAGFTVGVELLLKANAVGARIAEMPLVLRYDRKESASKLRLGRTLIDYWHLLRRVRESSEAGLAPADGRPGRSREWGEPARIAVNVAADTAAVAAGFGLGFLVTSGPSPFPSLGGGPSSTVVALRAALYAAVVGMCFSASGLHSRRSSASLFGYLQQVLEALAVATTLYFTVLFLAGVTATPLAGVVLPVGFAFALVLLERRGVVGRRRAQHRRRQSAGTRVLVYAADAAGRQLAKQIQAAPLMGAQLLGFIDDAQPVGTSIRLDPHGGSTSSIPPRVLGGREDLARIASETLADQLYIGSVAEAAVADELVVAAKVLGLDVAVVPRIGASGADLVRLDEVGTIPVLRSQPPVGGQGTMRLKRAMDIAIVILMAPVAIPVAAVTAVAVALDGRPVLFRQTRIGRLGRPFTLLKFRTMRSDCDPYADSPADDDDPRVTRVGRLVRLAGIDELPQLLNVLRGDMSLVGPRPEMPQIAATYGVRERHRLMVRPGMTGIWQLSPDRAGPIHENLEHDFYYLRRQRLSFDVLILLETILFAVRCASRSLSASASEILLRRGAKTGSADPGPAPNLARSEPGYVLVALDQRRRPDEPSSWSEYIPRAATLARSRAVKIVAAERNEPRLIELSGWQADNGVEPLVEDSVRSWQLEYVDYDTPDHLHALAGAAAVVFTDLGFVADRASSIGVPVVQVTEGGLRCPGYEGRSGRTGAAERLMAAFQGSDDELRYA